jgi:hypothetical protein
MRPRKFTRSFLVAAGAAILVGTFAAAAAADYRDNGYHRGNGYQNENAFPKATYPRGYHVSRGGYGGGHRNHGYAGSVVAVPIIVAPPVIYAPQYPYYVQQPYPIYRVVPPPVPTYYGR